MNERLTAGLIRWDGKMKGKSFAKEFFLLILLCFVLQSANYYDDSCCIIQKRKSYYEVWLDYEKAEPEQIGKAYASVLLKISR